MPTRDGGKHRGTHTTLCTLAAKVVDLIERLPEVNGYSPGVLQSGKRFTGSSTHKVKIGTFTGGILLIVRQSRSVQEVRVFTPSSQKAKLAIARKLRDNQIPISFRRD